VNGKGSDPDYLDFIMSEKFGLDWWKEDSRRITKFIAVLQYEGEKNKKENEKGKPKSKFRPKMR